MKNVFKFAVAVIVTIFAINVFAIEISDELLNKIATVESNGKASAIGDNGKALGVYQLWASYIKDVNAVYGTNYKHSDAKNTAKAKEIVKKYLAYYGKVYEKKTGKKVTDEVLARIHNGGPMGYANKSTIKYWKKVKKA